MSKQLFSGSIGRKFAMALSALFLIIFLLQHFTINFTSVFSEKTFNELSHFMGTNPLIQFVMQPILMFGVAFHFIMGFVLEIKNRNARAVKYAKNNGAANSSWMSRNMIWSGLFILFFLGFHFNDFWIPEMNYKYIEVKAEDPDRYYDEVVHMFENPVRVIIYCLSFVFLALHLLHGFQSAFQSMGARHDKYTPAIEKIGRAYAILIPVGFIFIAVFHYVNSL
ncbi:succinate dehydrogenase / fumarate reductase cytochrome b subunit [Ekhidna lutea]|uniref:Succinate dehydrogenase / fumarate reductase cytochrome b subunit n=1 Tax=Ekhidna lutea TaxID=447679 RepID=A0A239L418_EKHLU|nr:succinate dehydrogenase cytochrome b subunit [Ekhidna lutea]SNT24573.1 succinate dehydrogenase / fumarate reductase cytochrome b subunit [Ekhidna lutea]